MVRFIIGLKNNIAVICMIFGLIFATIIVMSWLYGYWSNGLYETKFQIDSVWQGISASGVGLVGLFKWMIDSSKNSPIGEFPKATPTLYDREQESLTTVNNTPKPVVNESLIKDNKISSDDRPYTTGKHSPINNGGIK